MTNELFHAEIDHQLERPGLLEEKYRRAEGLLQLAATLCQQNDFQEILRLVSSQALLLTRADLVSIVMLNPRTQETIRTLARQGKEADEHRLHLLHSNIIGWVMKKREPLLSPDLVNDRRFMKDPAEGTPFRAAMCVPLQTEHSVSGHVVVLARENGRTFDAGDLMFLQHLAAVCAPFVSNAQRLKEYFEVPMQESVLLAKYALLGLLGKSAKFRELLRATESASRSDVRVFLEGPTGTGKELVARAIHKLSNRHEHRFVAIDCGAIPENLIESELFGHVRGAFTGATQTRKGLIEEADHGTLFMDEISNLPHDMQAKLLRVLQEGEVRPLGSNQIRSVDVRIIAASSGPVWRSVANKSFRDDLFYRLYVYPITVPTLHERSEDIPMLAAHFLEKYARNQRKKAECFHPSLLNFMKYRSWPGHIRELENFVERLVTLASPEMAVIDHTILPKELHREFKTLSDAQSMRPTPQALQERLDKFEEEIIRETLAEYGWNQSETARALCISEGTIRYKMERLRIVKP